MVVSYATGAASLLAPDKYSGHNIGVTLMEILCILLATSHTDTNIFDTYIELNTAELRIRIQFVMFLPDLDL